jgi:hypothetical protein
VRRFRRIDPSKSAIILLDAGSRVLPTFAEPVSGKVARRVVVSAADVDAALWWGPGLRWGIMGNMMLKITSGLLSRFRRSGKRSKNTSISERFAAVSPRGISTPARRSLNFAHGEPRRARRYNALPLPPI